MLSFPRSLARKQANLRVVVRPYYRLNTPNAAFQSLGFDANPVHEQNPQILCLQNRSFHSTTPFNRPSNWRQNPHHHALMELMDKPRISIQDIDKKMEFLAWDDTVQFNEKTFFLMVRNCTQRKTYQAALAAEHFVFNWMLKLYQQGRLDGAPRPNIFSLAIHAWVESGFPQSGDRAEALLDQLEELSQQGTLPFKIDTPIYTSVLQAYAVHGQLVKAQAILDRCRQAFQQGNESARPDLPIWSTLVDACARSTDGWNMAEQLFQELQQSHKEGIVQDPPDTVMYTSLINCCAKSKNPIRAEYWLEQMINDYDSGNQGARPNCRSYSAVLEAWALSETQAEAPERARAIKDQLLDEYNNGNQNCKPDWAPFHSLMKTWSNRRLFNAGPLAEDLLEEMRALGVKPGRLTFIHAVRCWRCSKDPRAEQREEELDAIILDLKRKHGHKWTT